METWFLLCCDYHHPVVFRADGEKRKTVIVLGKITLLQPVRAKKKGRGERGGNNLMSPPRFCKSNTFAGVSGKMIRNATTGL